MTNLDIARSRELVTLSELPETITEDEYAAHKRNYNLGLTKGIAVLLDAFCLATGDVEDPETTEKLITNSARNISTKPQVSKSEFAQVKPEEAIEVDEGIDF